MRIDLGSPASFADGHPVEQYDWLLTHDRVHRHAYGEGFFWAVSGYDEVRQVSREHRVFSNEWGISLEPAPDSSLESLRTMMIMMDPPSHTSYRRLVSSAFTPRGSAKWTDRVQALATQIVDEVAAAGRCDLVADVAGEMPSFVVADMLGLPPEEGRQLYHWTEIVHTDHSVVTEEQRTEAVMALVGRGMEVFFERRANPGDDLGSVIANAAVDGEEMTVGAFAAFFMLLVDAGGDTTRNLVAGGIEALMARPEQFSWLIEDIEGRLPLAVEELLRFCSPVVYMGRQALVDTEIGGQSVRAGDRVVLYYGAANRDPRVFERPGELDLTRDPNPHVAFGAGGPHYCLGSHLARIEIYAILREFLSRCRDLQLDGPIERQESSFICGPRVMPVRFAPGQSVDGWRSSSRGGVVEV